jgi:ElaB/YqjD/DUF883 family membrane-anchored ribosome-binding protein
VAQDLANHAAKNAAKTGRQAVSRAGEYIRQYAAQQPVTALLIAGAIEYALAYLIHRR